MKAAIFAALCIVSLSAHSGVKCTSQNGAIHYQDAPCPAGSEQTPDLRTDSQKTSDAARLKKAEDDKERNAIRAYDARAAQRNRERKAAIADVVTSLSGCKMRGCPSYRVKDLMLSLRPDEITEVLGDPRAHQQVGAQNYYYWQVRNEKGRPANFQVVDGRAFSGDSCESKTNDFGLACHVNISE
jgi:hypothetical protein